MSDGQVPGDPQERIEQIESLARGRKGDRGEQGERGRQGPGMPRGQRRAIVFLFLFSVAVSVAAYLAATRYYQDGRAAQQYQGQVFERRLCTTLGKLAAEKPPPGSAKANPSRAYLQGQHATLAELGPDVGCTP